MASSSDIHTSEIRKLAELLRSLDGQQRDTKRVKCAQIANAATALAILARKIS